MNDGCIIAVCLNKSLRPRSIIERVTFAIIDDFDNILYAIIDFIFSHLLVVLRLPSRLPSGYSLTAGKGLVKGGATRRIAEYRDRVLKATRRKEELETSLQRITRDAQSLEQTREALARVHLENVRSATFEEKVRVIEILDVKVYPSEDGKVVRISSTLHFAPSPLDLEVSRQKISMASPKL